MIQIQTIRNESEKVIDRLSIKNIDAREIIQKILELDVKKRQVQQETESLQSSQNNIAKEIGELYKAGKKDDADELKNKSLALKETTKKLSDELDALETEINVLLITLPNLPSDQVPKGRTAEDNEVVFETKSDIKKLHADALPHWELTKQYDLIDFELGVKITGAGFPVYKGKGAKLQRALINFFLDQATEQGYLEIEPPVLVNEDSAFGTGQLPDKEGQMYHVVLDNLFLAPTAEVPVTNIYRDVILNQNDLPQKLTAYTPCFRREAGSYGKDVRGLNRLHQFDKVEIVQIQSPEKSYQTLEEMRSYVSGLLEQLGLHYRILKLCGGDMSFASALTYDMEVYSIAQKRWLEVSSVSNFESFQANRLKLRFKDENNKTQLAHTLNGSALALPRIVAALLENNQTPDGIEIPEVLVPYTGFSLIS
ncbi:MAG TPA: serine--tRNA ligase [Bacteroidia bacterium]|nr:serine--tRNA ligase [Bacteroidia bacterium]HNT79291.1 serine--tRNA ligase [Bacteroidia bacterium]